MNDNVFKIHVDIAGKNYGLTINRSEEELVREAAKQIRQQMMQYRKKFSGEPDLTDKELLAMVTLQLSIENLKNEHRNDTSPFTEKILELTQELEDYLKDE